MFSGWKLNNISMEFKFPPHSSFAASFARKDERKECRIVYIVVVPFEGNITISPEGFSLM